MSDPTTVASEAGKMSDLLAAASLLLTVLGVVYGTWYAEITNAISTAIPAHIENRAPVRQTVRSALYAKALPLAVAAIILTALFLPDVLAITRSGIKAFYSTGINAFHDYNAVEAAFCVVVLLTGALAGYLLFFVYRLKDKLTTINTP